MTWRGLAWLVGSVPILDAAPPSVDAIYPAGGQRGSEVALRIVGKVEAKALEFWASDSGITWRATGSGEAPWRLSISRETAPGAHWLRFYNAEGSALPQLFVVGQWKERQEEEPNDSHLASDKVTTLPLTLNGVLAKRGDVDAFAITLEKGQTLRAEVMAYRLDAPIDPLLRLTDSEGNFLAWNHDQFSSLDPLLEYRATRTGAHILMISGFVYPPQARSYFSGSSQTIYRIALSLLPPSKPAVPTSEPSEITLPAKVSGLIQEARAEDRYRFQAVKDTTYLVSLKAQSINSPLDACLSVRDADDRKLAENDDSRGADPALIWKAPADGPYLLTVRDLRRHGGPDYHYELALEEALPSLEATVASHAYSMKAGGAALSIPVKLVRAHGHARPVTITLHGLPHCLDCQALTIPGTTSEANLIIHAPGDMTASAHVFSLGAHDGSKTMRVSHPFSGSTAEEGALLRNTLESFLLTVAKP